MLKSWGFNRIKWDAKIRSGRWTLTLQDVAAMNKTELVHLLELHECRVTRELSIETLRDLLISVVQGGERQSSNPVDKFRDYMITFFKLPIPGLGDQIPGFCTRNCYDHPDQLVLLCFENNKAGIGKVIKDRSNE